MSTGVFKPDPLQQLKLTNRDLLSQATRIYRKQQGIKKRLKSVTESNLLLEKQIKIHQQQIGQQRHNIQYLLIDLNKQLKGKFTLFEQRHLKKEQFKNNQQAHVKIQNMIEQYETIEKQSVMLKRVFEALQNIHNEYSQHSKETEQLVISLETANKMYEQQMHNTMTSLKQDFQIKTKENIQLEVTAHRLEREIDDYEEKTQKIRSKQKDKINEVERLKKEIWEKGKQLEEVNQWTQIVIDKNSKLIIMGKLKQKQEGLQKKRVRNEQLEIYLKELENQEIFVKAEIEKQNREKIKVPVKKKDKKR